MYKQLIIARRDLNMSPGKLAAQVSHASMAFLTTGIKRSARRKDPTQYIAYDPEHPGRHAPYKRGDLWNWAKEAFERGEDYFHCRPVDPNNRYGPLELCEPNPQYISEITFDAGLYEGWINNSFTKVVCGAKNKNAIEKAIKKAQELGMKEGEDYFLINDNCRTELDPENKDGSTLTCIGFKPMPAEIIDKIGKEYHLY